MLYWPERFQTKSLIKEGETEETYYCNETPSTINTDTPTETSAREKFLEERVKYLEAELEKYKKIFESCMSSMKIKPVFMIEAQ